MSRIDALDQQVKAIQRSPSDRGPGRDLWRQTFADVPPSNQIEGPMVRNPGNYQSAGQGRSITSTPAAIVRLLQALRSMAPGGWSDDRWEQTMRHFVGIGYLAIHRKASMMQQASFQVYRRAIGTPDGKLPLEENDPAYDLVRVLECPNPQDTWGMTLYRIMQQKDLTGTALMWMVPNLYPNVHPSPKFSGLGTPHELYVIPTATAIPQPAINPDFPDGYYRIQPVYPYGPFSTYPTPASAVGAPIPSEWVIRFQYPHPLLRYEGYSPQTGMKLEIDSLDSVNRSRWYQMKKIFRPNVIMSNDNQEGAEPLPDSEIERVRAMIESAFQSPENVGGLFVPPPGYNLEEFGQRPIDMDYMGGFEQLLSFILGGYGITKPAAGMVEDSAYATLFATLKQLHLVTLQPECDQIGALLTRSLAPFFGPDLIIEVKCARIDDHEILFNKLQIAMAAKAIKKNQLLKLLELPVTLEPWGEDMAGDPSPLELAQMQQQMMMAAMQPPPGEEGPPGEEVSDEEPVEDEMTEQAQPTPGPLGEGALGPRKALDFRDVRLDAFSKRFEVSTFQPKPVSKKTVLKPQGRIKGIYEQVREAIKNGH